RNVALTFPYMHDGRFQSLNAVLDHYNSGIITTQPTLDTLLRKRIPIAGRQKADLVYFLHTLTDTSMTKNPRFSGELKNFIH
ncbi:MAG TPA: cytochrome-c peroxidase, partial [Ferruginibacter sp.]|nr:cytochrome-c peroxidase [Ferruginibacter sp.]